LNEVERAEVKKVARLLLERLQTLLVLDWRNRAAARAQVLLAIEDLLDQNLPDAYTPDFYRSKCQELFHHIYEQQSA
jgi:type I restriction enzyme R subunit